MKNTENAAIVISAIVQVAFAPWRLSGNVAPQAHRQRRRVSR